MTSPEVERSMVMVFGENHQTLWLTFGHLMFPAQRFAFLRALRFETTFPCLMLRIYRRLREDFRVTIIHQVTLYVKHYLYS